VPVTGVAILAQVLLIAAPAVVVLVRPDLRREIVEIVNGRYPTAVAVCQRELDHRRKEYAESERNRDQCLRELRETPPRKQSQQTETDLGRSHFVREGSLRGSRGARRTKEGLSRSTLGVRLAARRLLLPSRTTPRRDGTSVGSQACCTKHQEQS
jgi:hypothetical protein